MSRSGQGSLSRPSDRPISRPTPVQRPDRIRRNVAGRRRHQSYGSSSDDQEGKVDYSPRETPSGAKMGLTADESVISPIENLDNTISRLYSYLSGSEGDPETDFPVTPPQRERHHNPPGPAPPPTSSSATRYAPANKWDVMPHVRRVPDPQRRGGSRGRHHSRSRSPSPTSSVHSSVCSSVSRSDYDEEDGDCESDIGSDYGGCIGGAGRGLGGAGHRDSNTLGSSGTGENVYSRINETATLPLPPIPPPPLDDLHMAGPAVPPRHNIPGYPGPVVPISTSPLGNPSVQRRSLYVDGSESDFQPGRYLVHTDSGQGSPPSSPPLPFPRTVPRTTSQQHYAPIPQGATSPHGQPHLNNTLGRGTGGDVDGAGHDGVRNDYARTTLPRLPASSSADRQNQQFQPPPATSHMLPLPTYPSMVNDFRDYSHFGSTGYRVKKQLKSKCSWKIIAIAAMLVVVALSAIVTYFIAMKIYDLNWRLEHHPLAEGEIDATDTSGSGSGAKSSPVAQYALGADVLDVEVPPKSFYPAQFYLPESRYVRFNVSVPDYAVAGIYGRRNVPPTHVQYGFFQVADGNRLARTKRSNRNGRSSDSHDVAFMEHMDAGLWYLYLYNDEEKPQDIVFSAAESESVVSDCPDGCHGHGDCNKGTCECFPGYEGWDCQQTTCPVLCQGNGIYVRGECQCHDGWKGRECHIPRHQCEVPNCNSNGVCVDGVCVCAPGFTGEHCHVANCIPPSCLGNGLCVDGTCHCFSGFTGAGCGLPVPGDWPPVCDICAGVSSGVSSGVTAPESGPDLPANSTRRAAHSRGNPAVYGTIVQYCKEHYSEVCSVDCIHGTCDSQRCVCEDGWSGALCDQKQCDRRCSQNGFCNNGTCVCNTGWNGKHCSLDGCHNDCHGHGNCQLYADGWRCGCRDGWKGKDCSIAMEIQCGDQFDNDDDGLVDCKDPDCCLSSECLTHMFCATVPNPMDILLRKQPPSSTASFYDRMRFLMEDDSVQSYATSSSFNTSQVSVIRGKVTSLDGSPLIGVRVTVLTQPLYGFTLTRELGLFDLLVNGGGSVTLNFQRNPFQVQQTTVMVPWNQMVSMDTVLMLLEREEAPSTSLPCLSEIIASEQSGSLKPVVLSTWQHTQLGACPKQSTVIPESQVLQESVLIPGTDIYLVYHSSDTSGYMSTIMIQLTPASVPANLSIVHLKVSVEGIVFNKVFEADPNIKYKFAWDRRNAYNQKVYGIVTAKVSVGYEYVDCPVVVWEIQTATMSGYDISSSEIGGWNLHLHHTYNYQEGILHKGDGTNLYLKERPRKVTTVMGTGRQRRIDCRDCDGTATDSRLMSPVALASGRDGSLYVGDFNYIRKLSSSRQDVTNILELRMPEVPYKYFMTVSPLDGKLYISDYESKQVVRVKTMGAVRELSANMEVRIGTGDQCIPGDSLQCGDKGPADSAKLFYPKGIAIDKDGIMYIADGANIRVVSHTGIIDTLIGNQRLPTHWTPMPCDRPVPIDQVKLRWPTALAINPLNDALYILDSDVVLRVTSANKVVIVAGRPLHCPPSNSSINPLLQEDQTGPRMATDVVLESPQHITFAPNGHLYIVESDGHMINRVKEVHTDGTISHYAGAQSKCDCQDPKCKCYAPKEVLATEILLNSPTAITVTPDNVLHVADMGNLRIHSIVWTLPEIHPKSAQYEVLYPQTQELYVFNRYGQHVATKNIITDRYMYNFTYNVNSYYGKLKQVIDGAGQTLTVRRDYATTALDITPPGGDAQKCMFAMDNMGQLSSFDSKADNSTIRFSYVSNTGLLEYKETSRGSTYLYEYDQHGRLSSLVQPTGQRMSVSTDIEPSAGAIARLSTDSNNGGLSVATNGNVLSVLHGEAQTKVSYLRDGALVVEYPFNMAVTMETTPHPLLSTEHQLQVKRKIILPDRLIHRLEWRYYVRSDGESDSSSVGRRKAVQRVGRRMRVGPPSTASNQHDLHDSLDPLLSSGYEGKRLMINGVNLLTFEYERDSHSEIVMNMDQNVILTVMYNNAGQPIYFLPAGSLHPVNMTYNSEGRLTQWSQSLHTVVHAYDGKTNFHLQKTVAGRATTRYLYKSKSKQPTDVILPSGKQYVLRYDGSGNLLAVTMPGQGRHHFHELTTLGRHRRMYTAPEAGGAFTIDFDGSGKTIEVLYPTGSKRILYRYDAYSRVTLEMFDWSRIHYEYYEEQGILKSIMLNNRLSTGSSATGFGDYTCKLLYKPAAALIQHHAVEFNDTQGFELWNAQYHYHYDTHFRVILRETILGSHTFRPVNFSYSADTGRLEGMKSFVFQYPNTDQRQETVRDENIYIVREMDGYGRRSDSWYRFNNHVAFTLEMTYDTAGRVKQWRRQIGTSDLKAYDYVYDIDGNLLEVQLNGQGAWRYEYDADSNLVKIIHHGRENVLIVDNANHVQSMDGGKTHYTFDDDGFMATRDGEQFEYNSHGLLVRAHEAGSYDVRYYYDGYDRLVARRDVIGGYLVQFFYADTIRRMRLTHIYDHGADLVTALYHDDKDRLFAIEQEGRYFYIALDPMGTPVVVFNSMGSVVKHMTYDPLGAKLVDSAPDFSFIVGFQGGIMDHITGLVHFHRRVYDPQTGRWTGGYYRDLIDNVNKIPTNPTMLNQYQHQHIVNLEGALVNEHYTDVSSWLKLLGYDMLSLIPQVTFSGELQPQRNQDRIVQSSITKGNDLVPITSAFQCAFERDMHNFIEISNVPRSKVSGSSQQTPQVSPGFAPFRSLFGDGVVLSTINQNEVQINVLDSANVDLANLATILLNNSLSVDLVYTIHGRDTHYFVKPTISQAKIDVRDLELREVNTIGGLNVTIHTHHPKGGASENGELQYVDLRLHSAHTVINLRYGTTVEHESKRVVRHAQQRGVEHAWTRERHAAVHGLQTIHTWTRPQHEELVEHGRVSGVDAVFIHNVELYPELADSDNNIQFITNSADRDR